MPRHATAAEVRLRVAALAAERSQRTVWVGIDGFGAAGKTSLAAAVESAHSRVRIVHVDDFPPVPGFPEWNWQRFVTQLVEPLRSGTTARYQVWHWGEAVGREWHVVEPGSVVVVEGVSATRREVPVEWDLTVWVDAPADVRWRRALERDGEELREVWLSEWIPPELAYAEREQPRDRVDLVVDGTARPQDLGQSTS